LLEFRGLTNLTLVLTNTKYVFIIMNEDFHTGRAHLKGFLATWAPLFGSSPPIAALAETAIDNQHSARGVAGPW